MPRDRDLIYFLDPSQAIDDIVALGGPLTTTNLLRAYCSGIFPWPVTEDIVHPDRPPLAVDTVRHHGEAVAVVVATPPSSSGSRVQR